MTITGLQRRILQSVIRDGGLPGQAWVRWGPCVAPEDKADPWAYDDFKPLVAAGLLQATDNWKHDLVRLTEAGWQALALTEERP